MILDEGIQSLGKGEASRVVEGDGISGLRRMAGQAGRGSFGTFEKQRKWGKYILMVEEHSSEESLAFFLKSGTCSRLEDRGVRDLAGFC